eukprot:421878_1
MLNLIHLNQCVFIMHTKENKEILFIYKVHISVHFGIVQLVHRNIIIYQQKKQKNHHELHTHHNEIKKNQFAPNFEKKCYKCGESHTKWKISRSGILMGIRCNNCKFAYWIKKKYKYKRNELNEVEKNTIIAQFKSSEEMQQEYAGLRGEAPPSSHNNKSKVLDECPSNGIESLSLASNSNSNNEGNNKGNNKGNNEFSCQVCKLLIGINSYFETEQDLKAHISALHKK